MLKRCVWCTKSPLTVCVCAHRKRARILGNCITMYAYVLNKSKIISVRAHLTSQSIIYAFYKHFSSLEVISYIAKWRSCAHHALSCAHQIGWCCWWLCVCVWGAAHLPLSHRSKAMAMAEPPLNICIVDDGDGGGTQTQHTRKRYVQDDDVFGWSASYILIYPILMCCVRSLDSECDRYNWSIDDLFVFFYFSLILFRSECGWATVFDLNKRTNKNVGDEVAIALCKSRSI